MNSSMAWRIAMRSCVPITTAYMATNGNDRNKVTSTSSPWTSITRCDAPEPMAHQRQQTETPIVETIPSSSEGMRSHLKGEFYGLFPLRQLWHPKVPYPWWDSNWDGREPPSTGNSETDRKRMRNVRESGVTRHIILIRHGQYDETHKEDEKRKLTSLGVLQAKLTGQRLAEMMKGATSESDGPCRIRVLRVSGMTRAKETADIIASYLPGVEYVEGDPMLNEGRPSHHIPGGKANDKMVEATDQNHPRIEAAFRKYFYRATEAPSTGKINSTASNPQPPQEECLHEFEIIVCHANVIRYFVCRALQLPPEAWLRYCPFNCSLTYLTIRPTGTVSCRMLGDIGHLPYHASTFSMHRGYNW